MSKAISFFFFVGMTYISFALSSCESTSTETTTVEKQPNILLIIGDDHGYADLGVNQIAADVKTPNLDKLAQSGVRFINAYASSPICSPSRVGLLTGAYQQRQKVFWYGGSGLSDPGIPTIAEILLKQGYATGFVGKFHYGSNDAKTDNRSFPLNHGYQQLFGFNGGRKHYLIHDNEKEKAFRKLMEQAPAPKQSLVMDGFFNQDKREKVEGFSTEILGDKAIAFIKEHQVKSNPFFLTLSFNAVHNFTHQLPEDYLKSHGLKGYRDWNPEIETYYEWYENGRKPNNPEGREHYLGQLHYLDKEIGKVMQFLEASNQLENTLIIYIGDNGGSTQIYANNTPYNGGKYTMYEGGLKVPFFISWKGKYEQNAVSKSLVSALDVLPTICEAAKIQGPDQTDGISLHPLLNGKNKTLGHETLFWFGGKQAAVRSGKWKYRWAEEGEESYAKSSSDYEGVALELGHFLYDLEKDEGEQNNLAKSEDVVFQSLKKQLEDWRKKVIPEQ